MPNQIRSEGSELYEKDRPRHKEEKTGMATEAVPAEGQEQALARIRETDQRDEEQIIALLAGELVHEYVYEFKDGAGRTQRGLSWAGIREYSQYRGNFRIEKPEVEDLGDAFRVMVQATDLDRNVTLWAGTHQPKSIRLRDGRGVIADDFAYEKAISKAQRNVIKNLMPVTVVAKVIEEMTGGRPLAGGRGNGRPAMRKPTKRPEAIQGVPENAGQLMAWSYERYGLSTDDVRRILDIGLRDTIYDLGDAWGRVQLHQKAAVAD